MLNFFNLLQFIAREFKIPFFQLPIIKNEDKLNISVSSQFANINF